MADWESSKRKSRALTERIYLMDQPSSDKYVVMGNRGIPYDIHVLGNGVMTCTCQDFENHEDEHPPHRCKHIWFIVLRVQGNEPGVVPARSNNSTSTTSDSSSTPSRPPPAKRRRKAAAEETKAPALPLVKRWTATDECPICFEVMDDELELRFCNECGNASHTHCFSQWAAYHRQSKIPCPYCRAPLRE